MAGDQGSRPVAATSSNHQLPDGNKRCAFLATVEFVERNGRAWAPAPGDPDETDRVIRDVASGEICEEDFAAWISPPGMSR
jgi:prophage maintenance system killer protein